MRTVYINTQKNGVYVINVATHKKNRDTWFT